MIIFIFANIYNIKNIYHHPFSEDNNYFFLTFNNHGNGERDSLAFSPGYKAQDDNILMKTVPLLRTYDWMFICVEQDLSQLNDTGSGQWGSGVGILFTHHIMSDRASRKNQCAVINYN